MKTRIIKVTGFPFVDHVNQDARPEITMDLNKMFESNYTGYSNVYYHGVYKRMGYLFDLRPYLNRYVYKQYDRWAEAYAPNKTMLRKVIYGRIDKILDYK